MKPETIAAFPMFEQWWGGCSNIALTADTLFRQVGEMVEAAGRSGVNVLCLQ